MSLLFKEDDLVDVSSTTIGTKKKNSMEENGEQKKNKLVVPVAGERNKKEG